MQMSEKNKEQMARHLQAAIVKAIVFNCKEERDWLLLTQAPSWKDILKPPAMSFIFVCRQLGIKWRELRATLLSASAIDGPPRLEDSPRVEKSHLRLVPKSELCQNYISSVEEHTDDALTYLNYNAPYETNIDSHGVGETTKG